MRSKRREVSWAALVAGMLVSSCSIYPPYEDIRPPEPCPDGIITPGIPVSVDLTERLDDYPSCITFEPNGPDATYEFIARDPGTYRFSTEGSDFDTVLGAADDCFGDAIACNDDVDFDNGDLTSSFDLEMTAGQSVIIVVDSFSEPGFAVLRVTGPLPPEM